MHHATSQYSSEPELEGPSFPAKDHRSLPWEAELSWLRKDLGRKADEGLVARLRAHVSYRQVLDTGTFVSSDSDDPADSEDDPVEHFLGRFWIHLLLHSKLLRQVPF